MSPEYVGFGGAVKLFFSNYTNFKGRSTRSEYWWWALTQFITSTVLTMLICLSMYSKLLYLFWGIMMLWAIAIAIPGLALAIRRMHDVGKSGWWLLINLVPGVGGIIFLVLTLQPSDGVNNWGDPAKA